jgi:hypothetical protein
MEGAAKLLKGNSADQPITSAALVVDLDGTLLKTDLLVESLLVSLQQEPQYVFLLPIWLLRGKAYNSKLPGGFCWMSASCRIEVNSCITLRGNVPKGARSGNGQ